MDLKRLSFKHKNIKAFYYLRSYWRQILPISLFQSQRAKVLASIKYLCNDEKHQVEQRVNYYNKLENSFSLNGTARKLKNLKNEKGLDTYYFDLYEYARYFGQENQGHFLYGDVTIIPEEPTFVKSRPILDYNENSVLLKWNKVRHFMFVKNDAKSFLQKKNMLVGRGNVQLHQQHRIDFMRMYYSHPLCNVGRVNSNELENAWLVKRMTIDEQLAYKFILCLEGNDVASNLKWVMSSNSIAVMPKPKFETWFMEGLLIPDFHYIQIKDDYSDVEEKLNYYIENIDEANKIIKNAHDHIAQFKNKKVEKLISIMVMQKYFELQEKV